MSTQDDSTFDVILALLMLPTMSTLRGFVLSRLWSYFVEPLGVPAIGIAHAIGIALVVSWIANERHGSSKDDNSSATAKMIGSGLSALLVWGMGALVHLFM